MSNGKTAATKGRGLRRPAEADLGFHWGPVNVILLGVGLLAVVVGFVLLAGGSLTLAPVLLVAGYCVLIPAALLVRGGSSAPGE